MQENTRKVLQKLRNILWILTFGWFFAFIIGCCGMGCCLSIILIPVADGCFKAAGFAWCPFDQAIVTKPEAQSGCLQVLYTLHIGIGLALDFCLFGAVLCATLIGIPFGLQCFRIAGLCISPFDKEVVPASSVSPTLPDGKSLS